MIASEAVNPMLMLRSCAETDLAEFLEQSWAVLEPGTPFVRNWHIDAICEHLEAVTRGEILRLVINVPPGYCKSRSVTVAWPCWEWGPRHMPHLRYLCASYSGDLSTDHSMERRNVIQSDWYQRNWGNVFRLTEDDNRKTQFTNDHRGMMIATSVGGTATGKGGERIIIDDPLNPKQALSDSHRAEARRWFTQTIQTRLRDSRNGAIVIVMQRLHEDDTAGLALEMGYEHLCLPAEYESDRRSSTVVPDIDPRKADGELLWAAKDGPKEVANYKMALGSYAYAGQFQQRPTPAEGGRFKPSWFRRYKRVDGGFELHGRDGLKRVMESDVWRFLTADTAVTKSTMSDYTAIGNWGVTPDNDLLLLAVYRERMEDPDVEALLRRLWVEGGKSYMAVEYKMGGIGICQRLEREGVVIKRLKADTDKVTRSTTATVMMENGKIYTPFDAPWMAEYEAEMTTFPNGNYDDQVDMTSHAANALMEHTGGTAWALRVGGDDVSDGRDDTFTDDPAIWRTGVGSGRWD